MKYQTFAETSVGASHLKTNKPCQDRSDHYNNHGMYIAVIADGHGSDNCFRSEFGSKFAVKAAIEGIKAFVLNLRGKELPTEDNFARQVKKLAGSIVDNWIFQVAEHYRKSPITEEELSKYQVDIHYRELYLKESNGEQCENGGFLDEVERPVTRHAYGATLVAACITGDYWFGIQIGDGKLTVLYSDGSYDQPVPWDEKCYLNVTTSICDDDAAERARVFVRINKGNAAYGDITGIKSIKSNRSIPTAIFVNSDGIDDSFPIDENMDHMVKKFYYPVLRMFTENDTDKTKGWDASVKELAEFLPGLSKRGSGDDISVSGIIDMLSVKAEPFQNALQKAKKEVEERRAREQAKREEAIRIAEEAEAVKKAEKESVEKKAGEEAAEKEDAQQAVDVTDIKEAPVKIEKAKQPVKLAVSANDLEVQKTAQELKALQNEEKELKQKIKEVRNRLKETVEVSRQRNAESEEEIDIPASDADKGKSSQGSKVDIKA